MSKFLARGRAALTGVVALVCASAAACDSVLDIDAPKPRPDLGEGGDSTVEPSGGQANVSGSAATQGGGGAGEAGSSSTAGEGGEGGEGGSVTPRDCETDSARCTDKTPEVCDSSGHWVQNTAEAEGDCAALCDAGKCVECLSTDAPRCSICEEGDQDCTQRMPQTCVDGAWVDARKPCDNLCNGGSCVVPASCNSSTGSQTICDNQESCCRSNLVTGGAFKRDFDDSEHFQDDRFPAKISSFLLDKFEVTVGRFREFVDAYPQLDLKEGEGKAAHIASDTGWSENTELPADKEKLIELLQSCDTHTWPAVSIEEQQRPINCVSFSVAYAFCIWDGGRLPTEAEWNYAAAGGEKQRSRPWQPTLAGPEIGPEYAYYYADDHLSPTTVGKTPLGNGRWGQADLAGNVSEWVLDYYAEYSTDLCVDCLNHTASDLRVTRGGSFQTSPDFLVVPVREQWAPDAVFANIGFRCARDVK